MLSKDELRELELKTSDVVRKVGEFIMTHWEDTHVISYKNERDSATEVDTEAENMLKIELSGIFPDAGFIVEEGENSESDEYNWVIDPIDGTKQFVHQMPLFNTQVALMYKDEPVLGVIYNPVSKQLFSASKGNGASLNKVLLHPSFDRKPEESIIDVDFGGQNEAIETKLKVLSELFKSFYRVRIFAGIYGTYMTTGALDGTISIFGRINLYDYAPKDIIEQEVGIKVAYKHIDSIGMVRIAGYSQVFDKLQTIIQTV
jgi:myo-inositol-1(or 4)-monophosphatase